MRSEHLRPLLDSEGDSNMFFGAAQSFARAQIPEEILAVLRVVQMTALEKPDGGIRGIVVGDVIRRLVAKTISEQFMLKGSRPQRCLSSSRCPHEQGARAAHVVQTCTDADPRTTLSSHLTWFQEEPCSLLCTTCPTEYRFSHAFSNSTATHRHTCGR